MTIGLHNVRSAWNVGSIMRTCDALGADLVLTGYTPRPIGKSLKLVKKTSIGAENTVKWCWFNHPYEALLHFPDKIHLAIEINKFSSNLYSFLQQIYAENGINSQATKTRFQKGNFFLWFGNEISGLEEDFCKKCYKTLHLPMKGQKESLNVATSVTAAGYLFDFHDFCKSH